MNIRESWNWLWDVPVDGPKATLVLRLMAGSVFVWEGVMKFIFVTQGVGRFAKLGFPFPGPTADFVAVVEIVGGLMLLTGLRTRFVAIVFMIEMAVAMLSTKITMFLGTSPLPLPPVAPQTGFWAVLHEIRSEFAQMFVSLFLMFEGPGRLSFDALLKRRMPFARPSPARASGSARTPELEPAGRGLR
jgi:putative oxidoreductase